MPLLLKRTTHKARFFQEKLSATVSLDMMFIPSGTFLMGSPEDEEDRSLNEAQHSVTISELCMGRYPVTQLQWRTVASLPKIKQYLHPELSIFSGDDLPVERVSWLDTEEFCLRLSAQTNREYRLPTESEWEYACRAGTTTPFHFGETISSEVANYRAQDAEFDGKTFSGKYGRGKLGEFREKTTPVGYFKVANNFGLFDMHGNVWEWCQDHIHQYSQKVSNDGSAWIDPADPESSRRILRGGSWFADPRHCRSAVRYSYNHPIINRDLNTGFRLALTL